MKRQRSDSITAAARAAANAAAAPLEPPAHVNLREGDRPFWDSLVSTRARDAWTAPDLELAAGLARCKADIERLQREIDAEGDVLENAKGTPVINPRHTLLETLSRRAVAVSRMLHVHAEATQGESGDQAKRNGAEKAAKSVATDDGLIPGLRSVK